MYLRWFWNLHGKTVRINNLKKNMEHENNKTLKFLGIYNVIHAAPKFTSIFSISGIVFICFWCISFVVQLYVSEVFSCFLFMNGIFKIYFYTINKSRLAGLELLLLSGMLSLCIGLLTLFDIIKVLNVNEVYLFYFFTAGLLNLILASSLGQYGIIDWSSFKNINKAVIVFSSLAVLVILNDLPGIDLCFGAISVCYGFGKLNLAFNFSELSKFPQKVNRRIYFKIEEVRNEYFEALKKNWDADRDLYL